MKVLAPRNAAFAALALAGLAGMTGLLIAGLLGFEEANVTLLLFSSVLIFVVPIAVFVHLGVTRELTREEKRIWIRALTGRRAPLAFSEYLTSEDRRTAARKLANRALIRRKIR